jgi:transcription-repair coupling factor (superfamily II helicase)
MERREGLRRRQRGGERVLIASRQVDRLIGILDEVGVGGMVREAADLQPRGGQLVLSTRLLSEGFSLPGARLTAIPDRAVLGWRNIYRPARRRAAGGMAIGSLTDLKPGDFVVHINHGVGIYRGLVQRGLPGSEREYLLIEYAGDDRLYVPTDQFDRVQKYLGSEDERPAIHRLGGNEWERTKKRAKTAAQELAGELIKLYPLGEQPATFARHAWQWMAHFYERCASPVIAEVKRHGQPQPMDQRSAATSTGNTGRIRAAFKAVMDGRQVAILVPTTVLAQQHFTFGSAWRLPCEGGAARRFRSLGSRTAPLRHAAAPLTSSSARTGCLQECSRSSGCWSMRAALHDKEKLQLRTQVDVLTLTATPIRTLHGAQRIRERG